MKTETEIIIETTTETIITVNTGIQLKRKREEGTEIGTARTALNIEIITTRSESTDPTELTAESGKIGTETTSAANLAITITKALPREEEA